jgi:hypothetical protein
MQEARPSACPDRLGTGDPSTAPRTAAGLREEFADRIGLHVTRVGERNVSLSNVDWIADALELSVSPLMAEVQRVR